MLCSDFRIQNLSHFTYEFGLGVPVIALTNEQTHYQNLLTAAPIAHGATVFLRFAPEENAGPNSMLHARLEFYDNDRIRSIQVGNQKVPLIFDYSTPFAYYISTLPDMNILDYTLNPKDFKSGLRSWRLCRMRKCRGIGSPTGKTRRFVPENRPSGSRLCRKKRNRPGKWNRRRAPRMTAWIPC